MKSQLKRDIIIADQKKKKNVILLLHLFNFFVLEIIKANGKDVALLLVDLLSYDTYIDIIICDFFLLLINLYFY